MNVGFFSQVNSQWFRIEQRLPTSPTPSCIRALKQYATDMKESLCQAASGAMNRLADHLPVVALPNTNESVFRFFYLYELTNLLPTVRGATEWKTFDLLVQYEGKNTLIEFKYYRHPRDMGLNDSPYRWKGGPGPKNEGEFQKCIDKLHRCSHAPIAAKYLVLAYQRANPRSSKHSYALSYDNVSTDDRIAEVLEVQHRLTREMSCKMFRVY